MQFMIDDSQVRSLMSAMPLWHSRYYSLLLFRNLTPLICVNCTIETYDSSYQCRVTSRKKHRLYKSYNKLDDFFFGTDLNTIYFYFSFFLLKSTKGTRWTIMYILNRLLDPEINWETILRLQSIPWWKWLHERISSGFRIAWWTS